MNLYITFAEKNKIKRSFLNLRKYLIIHTPEVVESFGLGEKEIDNCSMFLVNEEIKRQIKKGSVRRKLLSIIYSNPDMNDEIVREIIHFASELESIEKVVFLTEEHVMEEYYELFEEVSFFPTLKKIHVVQCKSILTEGNLLLDELEGDSCLS